MKKEQVYFLWGDESYLIDKEIKDIHTRLRHNYGEVELLYLDGDEMSGRQLIENLQFTSLFCEQRMVVIKKPAFLGKGKRKAARNDELRKAVEEFLLQDMEDQTLVLTAEEHDNSNPLVKILDRQATVLQFKQASPQYITKWAQEECKRRGLKASAEVINLLSRSGQDMYYLENLIEKLSLMTMGGSLTVQDLEEELENKEETRVFALTDALLNRNLRSAFRAYNQLLEQGEPPLLFLNMTGRQFFNLGKVKAYMEKGYDKQSIAAAVGMKEYGVQKLMSCARGFAWEEMDDILAYLMELDLTMKSTQQDGEILMESMLVKICRKK
ncbi:DNA polymerase III subunit delta [Syntrophomonas palmitatica]|uniref:DNA polymerase III subunit delta n=1 Tax=Syntrophomonas palmitatica TaxID=402877 RepID=UPI000AFAB940|nr:DNA polymerase III subunit delta [Syntrophomonas palmitatica]